MHLPAPAKRSRVDDLSEGTSGLFVFELLPGPEG
jgi:hypothetical protein